MQEVFEPSVGEGNYMRSGGDDDDLDPLDLLLDQPRDFDAAMEEQLDYHNPIPEIRDKVEVIFSLLDDRGYLELSLETLSEEEGGRTSPVDESLALHPRKSRASGFGGLDPAGVFGITTA